MRVIKKLQTRRMAPSFHLVACASGCREQKLAAEERHIYGRRKDVFCKPTWV